MEKLVLELMHLIAENSSSSTLATTAVLTAAPVEDTIALSLAPASEEAIESIPLMQLGCTINETGTVTLLLNKNTEEV